MLRKFHRTYRLLIVFVCSKEYICFTIMKKLTRKNNIFIYAFSFLYLTFYLLSPFFHHHYKISADGRQEEYHSHLLKESAQKINAAECHHTLHRNDEHNHPLVINAVISNLPPRQINSPDSELVSIIFYSIKFQSESSVVNITEDLQVWKILKNKCVHSANNVSPPFVLVA